MRVRYGGEREWGVDVGVGYQHSHGRPVGGGNHSGEGEEGGVRKGVRHVVAGAGAVGTGAVKGVKGVRHVAAHAGKAAAVAGGVAAVAGGVVAGGVGNARRKSKNSKGSGSSTSSSSTSSNSTSSSSTSSSSTTSGSG